MLQRGVARLDRALSGARAIRIGADLLYADSVDRYVVALGWKLRWLDHRERSFIAGAVRPGMVTVDVGANIGLYTLGLARQVGASGRVYAIEPETRNFRLLSRMVEQAGTPHVELRQIAAADHNGWMTLYLSEADRGDHRIFPAAEDRQLVTVRALSLDELLAGETRVDFVKVNVQGAEVAVLRGLRRTLRANPDIGLLCNISPELLRRAGAAAGSFFEPLRDAGFRPHSLGPNGQPELINETMAWSMARAAGHINLYFRRC